MSNVVLAGLVKTAVEGLVNEQKSFNLATVLSRLTVPQSLVVDVDAVEIQVNKMFFTDGMPNYEVMSVDGDVFYAPESMGTRTAVQTALGKPVSQRHIYNLVYSPDSRGRIRFPVSLTATVQKTDSNKVWVATNGDEIRVTSHKPRSVAKPKQYTIDCYGNILLKAPTNSVYQMSAGRNALVAKPVTM